MRFVLVQVDGCELQCNESNLNPMGNWLVSLCWKSLFVCFVLKVEVCDCFANGLIDRNKLNLRTNLGNDVFFHY